MLFWSMQQKIRAFIPLWPAATSATPTFTSFELCHLSNAPCIFSSLSIAKGKDHGYFITEEKVSMKTMHLYKNKRPSNLYLHCRMVSSKETYENLVNGRSHRLMSEEGKKEWWKGDESTRKNLSKWEIVTKKTKSCNDWKQHGDLMEG